MKDEEGNTVLDSKKFLEENLAYSNSLFDIVLCWNLPDYMEESLVKPTVDRLWSVMKPGGLLLVFFHTRDAGPDSKCYRYHVTGTPRALCPAQASNGQEALLGGRLWCRHLVARMGSGRPRQEAIE